VLANNDADIGSKDDPLYKSTVQTTGAFGLTAVRNILVEWSLNLGDACRQIISGSFTSLSQNRKFNELIVLCDRSLLLIKDSGGIIQQKRLECDPVCVCSYNVIGKQADNFILVTKDGCIQVYNDFNISWAAKLPHITSERVPVQVEVSTFGDQSGLIVTLDDKGKLYIGYLGTKPPTTSVITQPRYLPIFS